MRNTERERLMNTINYVSFAVNDINLYLDTHPDDQQALEYYEQFMTLRQQAVQEYNTQFGPLTADQVQSCNRWTWVDAPWPWERDV